MSIRQFRPMTAATRFKSVSGFDEITRDDAREVAARADEEVRRPQQPGPPDVAPPGRRAQAPVPEDRLQAEQVRDPGQGQPRSSTIRTGAPASRSSCTPTARSGTSCTPRGCTRATSWSRGRARTAGPATRCRSRRSRSAPRCTTSSSRSGRAASSPGPPARAPRSWPRKASTSPSGSARPRCGWCTAAAWRRSARSGNAEHELLSVGKAGKSRWLGKRPKVRGVAMNPVDHPLGGGEGKSSGGRPPTSPWGKVEGRKTRHRKKASTKLIVRGRKRGKATQ